MSRQSVAAYGGCQHPHCSSTKQHRPKKKSTKKSDSSQVIWRTTIQCLNFFSVLCSLLVWKKPWCFCGSAVTHGIGTTGHSYLEKYHHTFKCSISGATCIVGSASSMYVFLCKVLKLYRKPGRSLKKVSNLLFLSFITTMKL